MSESLQDKLNALGTLIDFTLHGQFHTDNPLVRGVTRIKDRALVVLAEIADADNADPALVAGIIADRIRDAILHPDDFPTGQLVCD